MIEPSRPAAVRHGEITIRAGSKSFAAAARLFSPAMRADAVVLYAWCRHCDDVIDGQHLGFATPSGSPLTPEQRLLDLRTETAAALDGMATDPVFAAFGEVMRRHGVPARYPSEHLDGYAMDVSGRRYETLEDTLAYCYGVAGTVGIMMAYLMGMREGATLGRACDLGLAFQLTNIARDIVEDAQAGRLYLPAIWLRDAGIPTTAVAAREHRAALAGVARRLVAAAEPFYDSAAIGIGVLPFRAAWAVSTARRVYRAIGVEVVRRGPAAWDRRVSTSRLAKLRHVAAGGVLGFSATMQGRAGTASAAE